MKKSLKSLVLLMFLSVFRGYADAAIETDSTATEEENPSEPGSFLSRSIVKNAPHDYDPFATLYLGGFHAFSKTSIRVNSPRLGRGTTIDPEEVLGLEEQAIVPRAELSMNLGRRHELNLVFWTTRRSRTRVLEEDVQFADTTFNVNTSVSSKLNVTNYSITYRFSIFERERWNAGVSAGVKNFVTNTRITANLNRFSYSAGRKVYAPLPLLGLHVATTPLKHILIKGTAEYFKLNLNDWDFRVLDLRGGIEYYPIRHLGIGADYHFFDIIVRKVPSDKLDGVIEYRFNAFSLYLAVRI